MADHGNTGVRPAEWLRRAHSYTAYESESFTVTVEGVSCVITCKPSGEERFMQGDDVSTVLEGIEAHEASTSPVHVGVDHYLSQYF